jgi:hypothetical protein
MKMQKHFTLLTITMLPLLSGLAQTTKPDTAAPATEPSKLFSDEDLAATDLNSDVSNDIPAFGGRSHSNGLSAAFLLPATNLSASSLAMPALLNEKSLPGTNEPFSLDAIDLNYGGAGSEELSPPANLDEQLFQKLDLDSDGAVTLREWQQFDTGAGAKERFGALDENGDGEISVGEFLTQVPKHSFLYHLFGEKNKGSDSDFLWDQEATHQNGLRLFSFHF